MCDSFSVSDTGAKPTAERVLTPADLADYISFARQTCTPELTDAAAEKLVQGAETVFPQLPKPYFR
jgi:DNA replicative helicase MCM subunit Mcm2 (Cdc46/Mcm family)